MDTGSHGKVPVLSLVSSECFVVVTVTVIIDHGVPPAAGGVPLGGLLLPLRQGGAHYLCITGLELVYWTTQGPSVFQVVACSIIYNGILDGRHHSMVF